MQVLRGKMSSSGSKIPFNATHLRIVCVGVSFMMGLIGTFYLSTLGIPFFITAIPAVAILYVHLPIMFVKRRG